MGSVHTRSSLPVDIVRRFNLKDPSPDLPPLHHSILDLAGLFIPKRIIFRSRTFLELLLSVCRVIVDLNVPRDRLGGFGDAHDGQLSRGVESDRPRSWDRREKKVLEVARRGG